MVYESSYESGCRPFKPDKNRGYWASPGDFLYACWGLAFKLDMFTLWFYFYDMGFFTIIPYLFCMVLYVVPVLVIQLFIGQFSSSGFISVFRIAPLLKGMGYISLAVNFSILTYYSTYGAIPLFFLFNSLRPRLPWSCEAVNEWGIQKEYHMCNITTHNNNSSELSSGEAETNETSSNETNYEFINYEIPSEMYFRNITKYYRLYGDNEEYPMFISWQLVGCMFLVWALVAYIFYKFFNVEKLGKFMRYSVWTLMTLLLICVTRFAFLPGAHNAFKEYFWPSPNHIESGVSSLPALTISSFGLGWGTIISLVSYNKFRTNIMRYSWFISLGHFVIMQFLGLMTFLVEHHFNHITDDSYFAFADHQWIIYLSPASAIASIEWPNMWSIIFFSMQLLAALLVIVTQLFAILTALFDEFEYLRCRKEEVAFAMIGALALCSIYFCSNHGLIFNTALSADAFFTQTCLNLLLLLVVLWIYGRVRFQRDIEFMLGQRFATWRVNMLRFITPIGLAFLLILSIVVATYEHYTSSFFIGVVAVILIVLPWFFIPGYAAFSIFQTSGSILMRLKRCCHPTDWYPVDAEERQRYEEDMGNMDITHQLNEVGEEVM